MTQTNLNPHLVWLVGVISQSVAHLHLSLFHLSSNQILRRCSKKCPKMDTEFFLPRTTTFQRRQLKASFCTHILCSWNWRKTTNSLATGQKINQLMKIVWIANLILIDNNFHYLKGTFPHCQFGHFWCPKQKSRQLFNINMSHCQILGKFEYGLPAKFWRLVGCTEMLSW